MTPELKQAFNAEMSAAIHAYNEGQLDRAFTHLEIAHVLGQRHVNPHVKSHWWMLKVGLQRRSWTEVTGQGIRIILGALGSAVGVVPRGNAGGTNISMFKRLPINARISRLVD